MSDSVAWCILAGFKITSVFSRIIYHIIDSVCEFAASILQGYVYGDKGITIKVTKKSHQRKRRSTVGRTEDEIRNAEEPETRNFSCKSNESALTRKSRDTTEDMLTISGQRFCFRGTDKIIECDLRDARKITVSFDFYPFQNQSTVEIVDPSKHGASGHRMEENGDSSIKPKLSTDPKQANDQLDESEIEADVSGLKYDDESKLSEKTILKSDCSAHTARDNLKLSSDTEDGIIINGTQYKVDSAAHSDAKKQTTSHRDEKQIPETLSQKQQDTSADIKNDTLIPTEKNQVLEVPFHNETIPSLTIAKKPGSDSAAHKKPLITSTTDKIKNHALESTADENKMHVPKYEKKRVTVSPIDKFKKPMTQSTTNKNPVAAFPVDKKEDFSECHANKKSLTGPTADKRPFPAAATDKRSVPVATTDTRPVRASATDKKPAPKPVSELVPDKKPVSPSTSTKGSVPLVSTDKKPAVEAVADKKHVPLRASGIVPCKNPVPKSAATKDPVPPSATKDPVPEASANKGTVPVVAASNRPTPEAVTNKKLVTRLLSVHIADKKHVPASAATKVPVPVEATNKGPVPVIYADNMPIPEGSHDKKSDSVSPTDKKPVPVLDTNRKPDLASAIDKKPVLASTATKGPVSEAVADQKHVTASEADKKPTQVATADRNPDPVSLANKNPVSVPVADKKPVMAPAAYKKPVTVTVTDKVSVSATSADKRCASALASDFRPVSAPDAAKEHVPVASADKGSFPAVANKKPAPASATDKKPITGTSVDKSPVASSAEKGPLPTAVTDKMPTPASTTDKKPIPEASKDKKPVPLSAIEKGPAPAEFRGRDGSDLVSQISACSEGDKRTSQMPKCSNGIKNESEVFERSTNVLSVSQVYAEPENIEIETISEASTDSEAVGSNCKAVLEINEGGHIDSSLIKKLDVQRSTMDTDGSGENFSDNFYKMLEKGPPIVIAPDVLLNPSMTLYHESNSKRNVQNIGMNSEYIQDGWDDTDKYFYDYVIEREKEMGQFDPSAFNAFSTDKGMPEENGGNESKNEERRGESPMLHGEIIDKYNPMTDLPKYYDLIAVTDSKYILVKSEVKCYKKREVIDNLETAGGASNTDNPNGSSAVGQPNNAAERRGREVSARGESSNEHPKHRKNFKETGARPRTYSRAPHK